MNLPHSTQFVLKYFEQISKIPRPSKHEEKVREWLKNWSREHQFHCREDQIGNLVVDVPGVGSQRSKPLIIQNHLDMVCEKTAQSQHDFMKDPLKLVYDGEWLGAQDTSLGADNGIGVALAMAVATAKDLLQRPPLQLLFTVDEETGLTGASQLDVGLLDGDVLINLDSEEEGVFIIGCAGGQDTKISLPLQWEDKKPETSLFELNVTGLCGGHSGIDIHKERGNAIHLLFRCFADLTAEMDLAIVNCQGGTAHNAIPRSARLTFTASDNAAGQLEGRVQRLQSDFSREFHLSDAKVRVEIKALDQKVDKVWSRETCLKVINFILACPFGVAHRTQGFTHLVETSSNLAILSHDAKHIEILTSQRSAVASRLEMITEKIQAQAQLAGADYATNPGYPPWQPNANSDLLKRSQEIYKKNFNKEARVEVIHAGLECGLISAKCPHIDMISFGPTIKNAHSPDEKLKVSDIEKIWLLLVKILEAYS